MVKEKKFDCVKMKHQTQQKRLKESQDLSREERRKKMTDRILADPILGPAWRRALKVRTSGLWPKT